MPEASRNEYVAFDFETTGLSATDDRVIEIGAVRFDASGQVIAEFESLVNPRRLSGATARAIHGITDEELAVAPTAEVVFPRFLEFLGDPSSTTLLAHNATFDAGFLGRELARLGRPMPGHTVVDTLAMARKRWPNYRTHRLEFLARTLGLDPDGPHRALADSRRVVGLWLAIDADARLGSEQLDLPLAYPIFDPLAPMPAPQGWAWVNQAIQGDQVIRIEYRGGTRGLSPREITPRGFSNRGGVAYLVAICHIDRKEKEFRLDRVRSCALVEQTG